jgi:hypothetical protein
MNNNIENLLNIIQILYDRKQVSSSSSMMPILELYEYEIAGYKPDGYTEASFGTLYETSNDKCGLVKTIEYKNNNESSLNTSMKSSCDIIDSDSGDEIQFNDKRLYDNVYKNIPARSKKQITTTNFFNISQIRFKKGYIRNREYIQQHNKKNIEILHEDALIYHIECKSTDKIIIIGDLHGSFHTFWRHIQRFKTNKIIDNNDTIAPGYKLIFLGDILDRGQHALEILLYIIKLILNNNTETELKVIYNRGNHEMIDQYTQSFQIELQSKIKNHGTDNWDSLNDIIDDFFTYLPSAIILQCENKRFWLSHGGFPVFFKDTNIKDAFMDDIKNIHKNKILILKNDYISNQIRWNDFQYQDNEELILNGRGPGFYYISQHNVDNFTTNCNIDYIIRGHQDYPHNSWILTNNPISDNKFRFPLGHNQTDFIANDNGMIKINHSYFDKNNRKAVRGPIARVLLKKEPIKIHKNNNNQIKEHTLYPVITLSTNTDLGRPMNYESFGILRFDLDKDSFGKFGMSNGKNSYIIE